MSISIIIITFNESINIQRCLESVKWADEIIIVDSGSNDNTVKISKQYTNLVYEVDWPGFGPQKNRALAHATSDWVLSIDADEFISEDLKNEILEAVQSKEFNAYKIPRLSSYCGKFLKHGGWWPDHVTRLIKKGEGQFTNDLIHEKIITDGAVGILKNHIVHYRSDKLEDTLDRMNKYSTIWANENKERKKSNIGIAILHSIWTFIRIYLIRMGFLDGREGFLMAVSNSIGSFYKYVKIIYQK
jgi:glycosyltransferase involved in cell wall biosynthesis